MKLLDWFEDKLENTWIHEIRDDAKDDWLRYEGDLQAALYHHLRNLPGLQDDVRVLAEYSPDFLSGQGAKRIDLGIEFAGRGDLQIAIELKWLEGTWTDAATYDLEKLKVYSEGGARRGYFCFLSTASSQAKVRGIRDAILTSVGSWGKHYLRVAEGFWKIPQGFRVRPH